MPPMLSDEIRTRLSQLHARPLPERRQQPAMALAGGPVARASSPASFFERAEECHNASGAHLRLRRPLTDVWLEANSAVELVASRAAPLGAHPELIALAESFPREALFLDLETCGFAGASIFLAGVVWHGGGGLVLDQLFARHFAEERSVLEALWQIARANRVLVTFNGKSFDWPLVHDRSSRHRLGRRRGSQNEEPTNSEPQLLHCDLLHHSRRRWKRVLPDCKLQTLERYVCRRARLDDLAGAEVPAAYQAFVRTGDPRAIDGIIAHNALDLATLVELGLRLLRP
jgi:uncharacterized protein YprB with RNaseH-like and TPR domain